MGVAFKCIANIDQTCFIVDLCLLQEDPSLALLFEGEENQTIFIQFEILVSFSRPPNPSLSVFKLLYWVT